MLEAVEVMNKVRVTAAAVLKSPIDRSESSNEVSIEEWVEKCLPVLEKIRGFAQAEGSDQVIKVNAQGEPDATGEFSE